MRQVSPHQNAYEWDYSVGGNYRLGLEVIIAAAKVELVAAEADFSAVEQDAVASLADFVAIDRLLLAAAELAHGLGMCRKCFLTEVRRAYLNASEFASPDDQLEVEQIAREDARPCGCPAAEEMPLRLQTVLALRGAAQCDQELEATMTAPIANRKGTRALDLTDFGLAFHGPDDLVKLGPGTFPALKVCRYCGCDRGRILPAKPPHALEVRCAACHRGLGFLPRQSA